MVPLNGGCVIGFVLSFLYKSTAMGWVIYSWFHIDSCNFSVFDLEFLFIDQIPLTKWGSFLISASPFDLSANVSGGWMRPCDCLSLQQWPHRHQYIQHSTVRDILEENMTTSAVSTLKCEVGWWFQPFQQDSHFSQQHWHSDQMEKRRSKKPPHLVRGIWSINKNSRSNALKLRLSIWNQL